MIKVTANLFRIAAMAQSSESTRPYLCGVYIEPHARGVTMTATDGTKLVCIHDETGVCDDPVIVHLPSDTLRACKSTKSDFVPRTVVIEDADYAFVKMGNTTNLAVSNNPYVTGTFPDWRRVVPRQKPLDEGTPPTFNHSVMRDLCNIARELSDGDIYRGVLITGGTDGSAALVTFTAAPHAFGIAMPMRTDTQAKLPDWFNEPVPVKCAA